MYKARQNKEKVSRRINFGGSGIARQRINIENRRVANCCQFLKIPWEMIKNIRINDTLLNTGGQPANIIVNQYANSPGTFHHIYPKNKLCDPLMQIEKTYIYFSQDKKKNNANSEEVNSLKELRNILIIGNSANSYYWNPGTGFGGFAPQYRLDDPHNGIESKKPLSMDSRIYNLAVSIRPDSLNNLCGKIKQSQLNKNDINACKNNELELRRANFYNTDNTGNIRNSEWEVKQGFELDFNKPKRIYKLK